MDIGEEQETIIVAPQEVPSPVEEPMPVPAPERERELVPA